MPRDDTKLVSLETIDAADLLTAEFPEPKWVVPGIVPEGFTVLAGPPKIGKSYLVLGLALGVVNGDQVLGRLPVEKGQCLYLALEDNPRRLQSRLRQVLDGEPMPRGLELVTRCPLLDDGGYELIEDWLAGHPKARFVIIDTWAKIRPKRSRNAPMYEDDYRAAAMVKALADDNGVAVMAVHHYRKSTASDDWLDSVSGTTGFTGAADTILGLRKERAQADGVLYVTGRDVEEAEKALSFDGAKGTWTLLGDAAEYRGSKTRQEIIATLRDSPSDELHVRDIADATSKTKNAVQIQLGKMVADGSVISTKRGFYRLATREEAGT